MKTATIDNSKVWTVDDFLSLEETNMPCELINGELIMSPAPKPYHQIVSSNINDILKPEAKSIGGMVFYAPIDLFIDDKNIVQPDLLFLSNSKLSFITQRGIEGPPDLIVEVISPSNIFADRNIKKKKYLDFGVNEYWIVDPGNKTLEIYLKDQANREIPHLYFAEEGTVISTVLPNLKFELANIF